MTTDAIRGFLLVFPVLLFSIVAHEVAHGYAALKQGDATAWQLGRLSFNPIKHIDPFMSILLPISLALFHMPILGGAKPVPVTPRNYRNYKRGDIIVSLAGVTANLFVAIGCALFIVVFGLLGAALPGAADALGILQAMMIAGVYLNFTLIAFNLIPIPPLDGSHVFKYLLPPAWALKYQEVGRRLGLFLLVALLYVGQGFLRLWFTPADIAAALTIAPTRSYVMAQAITWLQ